MVGAREQLDNLLAAVEVASGAMRAVATNLADLEDSLPRSVGKAARLHLTHNAARLTAAADLLVAEAAAANPWTTSWVARTAKVALYGIGALGLAAGQGASQAVAHDMLASRDNAIVCVERVDAIANQVGVSFAEEVRDRFDELRRQVGSALGHPVTIGHSERFGSQEAEDERTNLRNVLHDGPSDLGVPNLRQRVEIVRSALALMDRIGALTPAERDDPDSMWSRFNQLSEDVETLATDEPSLWPPQPLG